MLKFVHVLRVSKLQRLIERDRRMKALGEKIGIAAQQLILLVGGLVYFFHLLGCIYQVATWSLLGHYSVTTRSLLDD